MGAYRVLGGLAVFLFLGCQSVPPPAPAVEVPEVPAASPQAAPAPEPVPAPAAPFLLAPDSISVSRDGFSPWAAPPNHTLLVTIRWSQPSALTEWAVAFTSSGNEPVRTIRGTEAVPTVVWDGTTDTEVLAPQGTYTAVLLTAGPGGDLVERDRTIPFFLDLVPASGTLTVTPDPYVPAPPGVLVNPPLMTIRLAIVRGGASWTTWRLGVFLPDGRRFRDFISEDHRDDQVVWDGRALNNAPLDPGVTYRLEAEVFDVYGNRGVITGTLAVAAPPIPLPAPSPQATTVTVSLNGAELAALPLYFAPYSSDLSRVTGELRASNDKALGRLKALLDTVPGASVTVVGHANQVLYQDPVKAAYEQRVTLIPLSLARAEAVKAALVAAGVEGRPLLTRGVGARDPVAAFSDAVNRWKNRRVVLELTE